MSFPGRNGLKNLQIFNNRTLTNKNNKINTGQLLNGEVTEIPKV